MRMREAEQPRKVCRAEVETVPEVADSNRCIDMVRGIWVPPWSMGMASIHKGLLAYLRDLIPSQVGKHQTRPIKLRAMQRGIRSRTAS